MNSCLCKLFMCAKWWRMCDFWLLLFLSIQNFSTNATLNNLALRLHGIHTTNNIRYWARNGYKSRGENHHAKRHCSALNRNHGTYYMHSNYVAAIPRFPLQSRLPKNGYSNSNSNRNTVWNSSLKVCLSAESCFNDLVWVQLKNGGMCDSNDIQLIVLCCIAIKLIALPAVLGLD